MRDNYNGTVTDEKTGLMWEQSPPSKVRFLWADASYIRIAEINKACLGGFTDWRLPTIEELFSIVDYKRHNPAIDPIFTAIPSHYWSITTLAEFRLKAWIISFDNGNVLIANKRTAKFYVRAVRRDHA